LICVATLIPFVRFVILGGGVDDASLAPRSSPSRRLPLLARAATSPRRRRVDLDVDVPLVVIARATPARDARDALDGAKTSSDISRVARRRVVAVARARARTSGAGRTRARVMTTPTATTTAAATRASASARSSDAPSLTFAAIARSLIAGGVAGGVCVRAIARRLDGGSTGRILLEDAARDARERARGVREDGERRD
jgi:hypothetical protein